MLLLALTFPALSATLTVGGSATYSTIEDAISAASSGDTITVAAGTYTECLDTGGKDLTISGAGSGSTVLESDGYCSPLTIESGETVTVTDLTIEDGYDAVVVDTSTAAFEDVIFTGNTGTWYGGALYLFAATVTLQDVSFDSNESYYGGAVYADASDLALTDVSFTSNIANYGAALYADVDTTVEQSGGDYTDNFADYYGGAVYLDETGASTFIDVTFEGNTADWGYGGAVYSWFTQDLTRFEGVTFDSNSADYYGGAIYLYYAAELELDDSELVGNVASTGGAIANYYSSLLDISDTAISGNEADYYGGAVYQTYGSITLDGVTLDENIAGYYGGALYLSSLDSVDVARSRFCLNEADYYGGAVYSSSTAVSDEWKNNIFQENYGGYYGGALYASGTALSLTNNTFVGNEAGYYGGSLYLWSNTTTFVNNIVAYTVDGDGLYELGGSSGSTFTYSDWYDNSSAHIGSSSYASTTSTGSTTSAPSFDSYSLDGDCDNDDLSLSSSSALIDAGDPSIYDLDGSRSDIGATGGPNALDPDEDEDGYGSSVDCDDTDAAINPGASEIWYDGIDSDCDGWSDYDADADGEDASDYGGTDCDDADATVYSTATEACDEVDNDCDGDVDEGVLTTYYYDADHDFAGDPGTSTEACSRPTNYRPNDRDCDDSNADVHPWAEEVCDGIDNDCSGSVDDDATDGTLYYSDADGDGYGDAATETTLCEPASGYVEDATDCDDAEAAANPGEVEVWYDGLDADCDGWSDFDADGDGEERDVDGGTDCDDTDAAINAAADEVWYDGVDQDCDGWSDFDQDGDAFDSAGHGGEDCDDENPTVHPDAAEVWYDGFDSNCDGESDFDADGDGDDSESFGGGDCNDADDTVYSGAEDVPGDGIDQDCDGVLAQPEDDPDEDKNRACAHAGGGAAAPLGLMVLLMGLTRRRR